jgi:predicted Na+-dependent transporter
MEVSVGLLAVVVQVIILPVTAGYVIQRAVGGNSGKVLAVLGALTVACLFMITLYIPGK